jgi:MFS family permease
LLLVSVFPDNSCCPGPCIGGIILTYSDWRSMYWLQVGQAGLGFALSMVFLPSIRSEVQQLHEKKGQTLSALEVVGKFSPMRVLRLYLRPQIFLADLACGFLAVTQYGLLTSVRHIINPRFDLTTPMVSGLFYIAPGAGFIVGSLVGGRLSDRTVKQYIEKRGGLRLPKDRLNSSLIHMFVVLPGSMLLYGWGLDKQFGGLALPIVMAFWIGVGLMGAWNGLNTYTAGRHLL